MAMLGYCTVGSNRLAEANTFYDALLGSAGITALFEHPSGGRIYGKDGSLCFGVLGPYDGKPATVGNGSMFAFRFDTREEVDTFHAKALALGYWPRGLARGDPVGSSQVQVKEPALTRLRGSQGSADHLGNDPGPRWGDEGGLTRP